MSFSGFLYGKVGVDVMPVTEGFRRELKERLTAATANMDVKIPVNLDVDDGAFKAWKEREEHDDLNQKVKLNFDRTALQKTARDAARQGGVELSKGMDKSMSDLEGKLSKRKLRVPMDAETKDFRKQVNQSANMLEGSLSKAWQRGMKLPDGMAVNTANKLRAAFDKTDFKITPDLQLNVQEAERQVARIGDRLRLADAFARQADQVRRRAQRLSMQMPDLKMKLDLDGTISGLEQAREKLLNNERVSLDVRSKLDLETGKANEELDRLQRKHDKLKMDLDLQTAGASAHLAYFTRPRTVDVFARFKGTDMGKILGGMTSGATGLQGVQSNFQKLVNLMDHLDEKVPRFSLLGAGFLSLGAGATNVMASVGGVAKSIVSMSKAAYAAPAALGATAAGLFGAVAAAKTASDNFSLAGTALDNLQGKVGSAFWDQARQPLKDMANSLGPEFLNNMERVGAEEGNIAAGLAKIVTQADEGKRINLMLSDTQSSLRELVPGVQGVVKVLTSLGTAGGQYLPQFSNWLSGMAARSAEWAHSVEADNGRVQFAMGEVKQQAGFLGSSIGSLKGIFMGTFGTLAKYEDGIHGFSDTLAQADKAVNSVRFQQTLGSLIDGAQTAQARVRDSFASVGEDAYSLRGAFQQAFGDAGTVVGSAVEGISKMLASAEPGIRDFTSGVAQGWQKFMAAFGDSGPAFSSLLSMTGQLASTFGGTLGSSLRASIPLIEAVAKGATAVSEAFGKLPQPIQAAIGLYMTFGRAGRAGLDALKSGLAENTVKTLQWQKTLRDAGMTAQSAAPSWKGLASTWMQMKGIDLGGAFKAAKTGVSETATAAEAGASSIGKAGSRFESFKGNVRGVGAVAKTAGSALLGAMGGPVGLAVSAGVGLMSVAIADYNTKAASMSAASQNISMALKNVATDSAAAAGKMDGVTKSLTTSLADPKFGRSGVNWLKTMGSDFTDASKSGKTLGYSLDDLAKKVAGPKDQYDKFMATLQKTSDSAYQYNGHVTEQTKAAQNLIPVMQALNKTAWENANTNAQANGYAAGYTDTLRKQGLSLESVAAYTQSAAQKAENHAQATKLLAQAEQSHASSMISERAAASQYYQTLDSMGDVQARVNELASQGQRVWDGQSKAFDMTSEAGRTASNAIDALAQNAQSYVQAMVAAGEPTAKVKEQAAGINKSLYDQVLAFTGSEQAAQQYVDELNLTPQSIETKVKLQAADAKMQMLQYLQLTRDEFGPEGDKEYKATVKAVTSGAITGLDEVDKRVQLFSSMPAQVKVLLSGDKKASSDLDAVQKAAKTLGLTPAEVNLVANTDNASAKLDGIRAKLHDKGLTDAEIKIILDAIDNATPKTDKVKGAKKDLETPSSFTVTADGTDAAVAAVGTVQTALDCVPGEKNTSLNATDNASPVALLAQSAITGVPTNWASTLMASGNTTPFANAASSSVFGVPTSRNTSLFGSGNTAAVADNATAAVNHVPGSKNTNVSATDNASGTLSGIVGWIRSIPSHVTSFIDVVTNKIGGKATGGEISGPGTGTSDSIPTMLSDGEYVLKASSVSALKSTYGADVLDSINDSGSLPAAVMPMSIAMRSLNDLQALTATQTAGVKSLRRMGAGNTKSNGMQVPGGVSQKITINNSGLVDPYVKGTEFGRVAANAARMSLSGRM
jgi:hypothetical protein